MRKNRVTFEEHLDREQGHEIGCGFAGDVSLNAFESDKYVLEVILDAFGMRLIQPGSRRVPSVEISAEDTLESKDPTWLRFASRFRFAVRPDRANWSLALVNQDIQVAVVPIFAASHTSEDTWIAHPGLLDKPANGFAMPQQNLRRTHPYSPAQHQCSANPYRPNGDIQKTFESIMPRAPSIALRE